MPDQAHELTCRSLGPAPPAPRDAEGKRQVGLRYDPADGVHEPKALTVTPGSTVPELELTAVLVRPVGVVLAGPDFTLVLPRRAS